MLRKTRASYRLTPSNYSKSHGREPLHIPACFIVRDKNGQALGEIVMDAAARRADICFFNWASTSACAYTCTLRHAPRPRCLHARRENLAGFLHIPQPSDKFEV